MTALLEVKNFTLKLQHRNQITTIFDNVSFSLATGETAALFGDSGTGKSSLALSLLQLQHKKNFIIQGGTILWQGVDILKMSDKQLLFLRKNEMKIIFQNPFSALHPQKKIGLQILEAFNSKLTKSQKINEIKSFLEDVHLSSEIYNLYPFQLSGGQKQRVMLAIALINKPKLLLADEPTTALDYTSLSKLLEILKKYKKEHNIAILYITHKLKMIEHLIQRFFKIQDRDIKELSSYKEKVVIFKKSKIKKQALTLLEAKNLTVAFKTATLFFAKSKIILSNCSFAIKEGETLGIMGDSGSGKTSLLKALLNIISYQGEISWLTKKLSYFTKKDWQNFRKNVSPVFQDPNQSLSPRVKILQILKEGLNLYCADLSEKEKMQKIDNMLSQFKLDPEILAKYAYQLSGGQQQRVGLIRAFLYNPKLLLLDEPTSSLDQDNQNKILQMLLDYQKNFFTSYIIVSHDFDLLKSVADRIFLIKNKTLLEYH